MPLGREVSSISIMCQHTKTTDPQAGHVLQLSVCLSVWLLLLVVTTAALSQVWSVGLSPLTSFVFPARCAMYL
jgi:hypothetical protein